MCVICKQARKTGRAWAGMGSGAQMPAPAVWVPAHSSKASSRKAQQPRFGKGAYVRAVPQIAGGPFVSQVGVLRTALLAALGSKCLHKVVSIPIRQAACTRRPCK